ncbi:hypothetical protein D3C85_1472940 [compost metagenome]
MTCCIVPFGIKRKPTIIQYRIQCVLVHVSYFVRIVVQEIPNALRNVFFSPLLEIDKQHACIKIPILFRDGQYAHPIVSERPFYGPQIIIADVDIPQIINIFLDNRIRIHIDHFLYILT